jgi:alpha-methylacyl-CoA racemase
MDEAKQDDHNIARNAFVDIDGFNQPGPAPRFSVDRLSIKHNSKKVGSDIDNICEEYNLDRKAFI